MTTNQKPNFTLIFDKSAVPVILPNSLQSLKDLIANLFKVTNKKLLYKENNDIIELESEEDYSEFISNVGKIKFLVVGDDENSYHNSESIIPSLNMVEQFELVESVASSEEKKDPKVQPKIMIEEKILAKPDTLEKNSNAIIEQKDKSENASIVMKEKGDQIGDLPKIDPKAGCPCFLCYGKRINKKGKPCKRCNGTGAISQEDFAILKKIVAEEAKSCVTSMIDEVKSSLAMSMRIGKEEPKEPQKQLPIPTVVNPIPKNIPMSCHYCSSPFMDLYYSCPLCPQLYLCQMCESQKFHPHDLKKIYASVYNEKPKPKEYSNKVTSQLDCITVQPGQDFMYSIMFQNTGSQWPVNAALYYSNGDNICASATSYQCHVGPINSGMAVECKLNLRAPVTPGKYSAYFRMGYNEDTIKFFGEKPWVTIEVKVDPNSKSFVSNAFENNLKTLIEMGFGRDTSISILKYFNNDLTLAIQYLTSSNMQNK
jgi:hypothetical protein